ncbi:hypothetical protein HPB48_017275 [Haemaphysalis longicornis]|uniref:ABC transporter n=1 Tax=Haemaphysalis longicornis TaxID=44386 RepID=A0A9J6FQL9_HAELO|nr:hypothetical protein HPB48_017275 [Haemaphysalis longicornis]
MSGPCLLLALLSLAARAATVGFFLYWIKLWTDAISSADDAGQSDAVWIGVLIILCLCDRRLPALPDYQNSGADVQRDFRQARRGGTQAPAACVFGAMAIAVFLVVAAVSVRAANALRSLESARWSRVLQHLTETRDSITTVRCFGAVTLFQKRFYRLLDEVVRPHWAMFACMRLMRVSGAMAGLFAILVAMGTLVLSNPPPSKSSVGLALSSVMSVRTGTGPWHVALLKAVIAAHTKLTLVLYANEKPKPTITPRFAPKRKDRDTWPQKGEIVFENFSASYKPGVLPPVLNNLSFVIKPNEKVGVVGRTGAGKSSLILALLRVLKPSCGRIVMDKADISSVALRKLRSVITVIPQEPYLMKGSLRDNLDGMRCHSDEQVWEALRKAHMANFVSSHPCGLLLEVDDGAENLSSGQRQLLCLARALLRAPRVLLLDEATSRLDGDTDRLIQQTLKEGFAASTVLTVAHRLHTVLHCDRILVMKDGSVAEFASVGELAANSNSIFSAMARAAGIDLSTFAKSAPFVRLK